MAVVVAVVAAAAVAVEEGEPVEEEATGVEEFSSISGNV